MDLLHRHTMMQSNSRQQRGQGIAESCEIKQVSKNTWLIPSQSGNGSYACTCKDFEYRNDRYGDCKHSYALDYYIHLQEKVLDDVEEQLEQATP